MSAFPYAYFFSYSHSSRNGSGFGSTEIFTEFPITSYEQIQKVTGVIADRLHIPPSAIVILNYQLLRGPEVIGGAS